MDIYVDEDGDTRIDLIQLLGESFFNEMREKEKNTFLFEHSPDDFLKRTFIDIRHIIIIIIHLLLRSECS